jgi:SPP1 gp7 family putative phage head morphogenesis protein
VLINVANDQRFQDYLDVMEQRLHVRMVPLLSAGIRLQMSRGGIPAASYVNTRGMPILLRHYQSIYGDTYASVSDMVAKARQSKTGFLRDTLDGLEREAERQIHKISQSLADFIRDRVMAGYRDGWSVDKIAADLIANVVDIAKWRAATIARTETHNAAMAGLDETLQYKNIPIKTKTWWSAHDKRVRPTHRAVHGTTIAMADVFTVGDSQMRRPGDDSLGASAQERINCRCTVLYHT